MKKSAWQRWASSKRQRILVEQLNTARRTAAAQLSEAAVPSPGVDADLLLSFVTGDSRAELKLRELRGESLTEGQYAQYLDLVNRRAQRIPLQHLTGEAYFRYLTLKVGPGVFSPRPETETVVQVGLDFLGDVQGSRCVDLCSGSGAIAAALATELRSAQVWAVEGYDEAISDTRAHCEP